MPGGTRSILVSVGGMTPAYCSPEQAAGSPLSRKTDIWSWGLSVLEMFMGEVTWPAGQLAPEALASYLETGPVDPAIPVMPMGVVALLKQCFQRDPRDRPANMLEVATTLQGIYQQERGRLYPREVPKIVELKADGLNNRGVSYMDLGREVDAVACWQEALKDTPQHFETTFNYGYWRWQKGEIPDDVYVTQIRELESSRRTDLDYWCCLAWIHLERGDIDTVERIQQSEYRVEDENFKQVFGNKERPVGRSFRILEGHSGFVMSVCFSPDGRYALSGSRDKTLRLWEVASGQEARCFEGHTGYVVSADFPLY